MRYDFSDIPTQDLLDLINSWVKDKRARNILKSRFIDGLTFDELSKEYYLSSRQIKRIV